MRNLGNKLENRKINYDTLSKYGFKLKNNVYRYEKDILNDEFKVIVEIENDKMISKLIENALEDEYLLADVKNIQGEYVGKIKEEYDKVIDSVIKEITTLELFRNRQSKLVIKYIKEKYNDDIEYLWEKFPRNGVWRNKDSKKWYAALLTAKGHNLGLITDDEIEVLDLRYQKENIENLVDNKKVFKGYHMNKNSWITVKLDDTLKDHEIFELIDNSYNLEAKSQEWIIPANPKYFDVISYFENNNIVKWHRNINMKVKDIVYIYMGSPYSSIMYKCEVVDVLNDDITLKLVRKYDEQLIPFEKMKELGVRAVRGPRTITDSLSKEISKL
ncbi:MAG: MmcQ/YjbR family DNA-binding protein [Bacilli bacterium]|nr:MmcQ/YjbR family DNA-binding protein [Bacilli bacterium]